MFNNDILNVIVIIIPILSISIIIFIIAMIFSPQLKGKMMSRQVKSLKHMIGYSKEDLTNLMTSAGELAINAKKQILNNNEHNIKDIIEKSSDLSSIAVEKTARAIKRGLQNKAIYCHYCGKHIDYDSKFCKHCGKEI